LIRALGDVSSGVYLDLWAHHPVEGSRTYALSRMGWRGVSVVRSASFLPEWKTERPDDLIEDQSEAPADPMRLIEQRKDLLSGPHVAMTDSRELTQLDLVAWRPWVLIVDLEPPATPDPAPPWWEPSLAASGYQFCLFDGSARFYVAAEHQRLAPLLSYPACVRDDFVLWSVGYDVESLDRLAERWARAALTAEPTPEGEFVQLLADRARLSAQLMSAEERLASTHHHAEVLEHELRLIRESPLWRLQTRVSRLWRR